MQSEVASLFSERKLPLPVLTIVQVGGLGEDRSAVIIEAVVSTQRSWNPNGLAFFSGQTAGGLPEALERLKNSAGRAAVPAAQVLECTCFAAHVESGPGSRAALAAVFPNAAVNVVQAVRDPAAEVVTCEGVGRLQQAPTEGRLVLLKEARTTLVNTRRLVFTGLQLSFGSYLDDAREAFSRLQRAASTLGSSDSPVQVDAFSLDATAGSALRKTTSVAPSTFTVHTVEGLPSVDATSGIEAVLAPEAGAPPVTR